MKKMHPLKLLPSGRLPDGSLRFVVRLPKDVADLFEAAMLIEDRKKMPMARVLITRSLKQFAKHVPIDAGASIDQPDVRELPSVEPHFGALP